MFYQNRTHSLDYLLRLRINIARVNKQPKDVFNNLPTEANSLIGAVEYGGIAAQVMPARLIMVSRLSCGIFARETRLMIDRGLVQLVRHPSRLVLIRGPRWHDLSYIIPATAQSFIAATTNPAQIFVGGDQ